MIDEKKLKKELREKIYPEKFGERCNPLDVIYAILQLIDEQPKVNEWIPCSERLPDEGKEVLISYDYDSFDIEMTPKRYLGVMIGCYEDSEWWSSGKWTDGVTAWYPLPDPWEGDSK